MERKNILKKTGKKSHTHKIFFSHHSPSKRKNRGTDQLLDDLVPVRDDELVVRGAHGLDADVVLARVELALVARALQQVAHARALVHPDEHRLKVVALRGRQAEHLFPLPRFGLASKQATHVIHKHVKTKLYLKNQKTTKLNSGEKRC